MQRQLQAAGVFLAQSKYLVYLYSQAIIAATILRTQGRFIVRWNISYGWGHSVVHAEHRTISFIASLTVFPLARRGCNIPFGWINVPLWLEDIDHLCTRLPRFFLHLGIKTGSLHQSIQQFCHCVCPPAAIVQNLGVHEWPILMRVRSVEYLSSPIPWSCWGANLDWLSFICEFRDNYGDCGYHWNAI